MAKKWAISGVDLHVELQGHRVRAGLEAALREAVQSGRLAPGTRLPSSRTMAADLGIARNTVADVYGQLIAEGWLTARQGSGTRVAQAAEVSAAPASAPPRMPKPTAAPPQPPWRCQPPPPCQPPCQPPPPCQCAALATSGVAASVRAATNDAASGSARIAFLEVCPNTIFTPVSHAEIQYWTTA